MSFPQLSPEEIKLLEAVARTSSIDGSTLMKELGTTDSSAIVNQIRDLHKRDLIEVGGSVTVDRLPFVRIGVRPSMRDYILVMLKQAGA